MALLGKHTQHEYYTGLSQTLEPIKHGNYQFTSLETIINQFMFAYVGEDKIISKTKRLDVAYHAQRAMQELSFDTFKSCKTQQITLPPSLTMTLPHDYVNYTKVTWVDSSGIEHVIYPTSRTSNAESIAQDEAGNYQFAILQGYYGKAARDKINVLMQYPFIQQTTVNAGSTELPFDVILGAYGGTFTGWDMSLGTGVEVPVGALNDSSPFEVGMEIISAAWPVGTTITNIDTSNANPANWVVTLSYASTNTATVATTVIVVDATNDTVWGRFQSVTPREISNLNDFDDNINWPTSGGRYGLDPEFSNINGSFYIDCENGKIHFSSKLSGQLNVLHYLSDHLGTDGEMQVHKFAEEAMYKWIAHGILSTRINIPEYIINRFKKEKFAETRKAKLRLSNIKLEEITQIFRGKSKQIKH